MTTPPKTIVVLSSVPWSSRFPSNKQQVPRRLALDYSIVYVDLEIGTPFRSLLCKPHRLCTVAREDIEGIRILTLPFNAFPGLRFKLSQKLRDWWVGWRLRRALKKLGVEDYVLWSYYPCIKGLLPWLKPKRIVYHCEDEHAGAARAIGSPRADFIWEQDKWLCTKSDLVIVTSQPLLEKRKELNTRVVFVPNAVDFEHFNRPISEHLDKPEEYADLPHPILGFAGSISPERFDFKVAAAIAKANQDGSIVLIGGYREGPEIRALMSLANVHVLGHRDYNELPKYEAGFDVGLLLYPKNDFTDGILPLKIFEYLALGLPIAGTFLPSLKEYATYCDLGVTADDVVEAVSRALNKCSEDEKACRIAFAQKCTWAETLAAIKEQLNNLFV